MLLVLVKGKISVLRMIIKLTGENVDRRWCLVRHGVVVCITWREDELISDDKFGKRR